MHDFDDALNEFRNAPSIKIYSQATPNKHTEKQLTRKKVEGPTTVPTRPEKQNTIRPKKAGTVKAQGWSNFWDWIRFKRMAARIRRGVKRVGKKMQSPDYDQQSSSYGQ